jgi:hypothetical protein
MVSRLYLMASVETIALLLLEPESASSTRDDRRSWWLCHPFGLRCANDSTEHDLDTGGDGQVKWSLIPLAARCDC